MTLLLTPLLLWKLKQNKSNPELERWLGQVQNPWMPCSCETSKAGSAVLFAGGAGEHWGPALSLLLFEGLWDPEAEPRTHCFSWEFPSVLPACL